MNHPMFLVLLLSISSRSCFGDEVKCEFDYECRKNDDDPFACVEKKCVELRDDIGDSCVYDQQCAFDDYALCINDVCRCESDYVWWNEKCTIDNGYGHSCQAKKDCTHKQLDCVDNGSGRKSCQCPVDTIYSGTTNECLSLKQLGEVCKITDQCSGDRVSCRNATCVCEEGTKQVLTSCLIPKKHSESCNLEEECDEGDFLTCRSESCQCMKRYEYLEGRCQRIGCINDDHCEPGSVCDDEGHCKAKPGKDEDEPPKPPRHTPKQFYQRVECLAGMGVLVGSTLLLIAFGLLCRRKNKSSNEKKLPISMSNPTYNPQMKSNIHSVYPSLSGDVKFV